MQYAEPWISLKQELPKPGETVYWYDLMFDCIMLFALNTPETYDPDFTHYSRVIPAGRPQEYDKKYQGKPVGFYHNYKRYVWSTPCDFDHNGECLVCDCWPSVCPYRVKALQLGELLQLEMTRQLIPLTKFVEKTGIPRADLVAILQLRKPITPEYAAKIAAVIKTPVSIWINPYVKGGGKWDKADM